MSSVLYHRDYTDTMKELVAELGMTLEQHNMTLGCIMLTIHAYMLSYFAKAHPTMLVYRYMCMVHTIHVWYKSYRTYVASYNVSFVSNCSSIHLFVFYHQKVVR